MDDDGFTEVPKKQTKSKAEQPKAIEKHVQHLVLDTGAIIANVNLHEIAEHYYAPQDVLEELRSKRAMANFNMLPFEIIIREPSTEAVKAVSEAAKKTGDYPSLSVTDLKVIALTYDLNKNLKAGLGSDASTEETSPSVCTTTIDTNVSEEESKNVDEIEATNTSDADKTAGFCDGDTDDEEGWITEDNLVDALKKLGAFEVEEGVFVGCLTTDFALQNVLLAMDLSLVSLSGYRIQTIKSYVLRCRACYSTTSNMEKQFCPSCGNKMLHKCAVSINENGEQVLHVNWRRLEVKRGLQHSIAAPKGGKHAINEKLFEDQPMPQNRMAKLRADPLGDGPFSMHDITSRSALLGIRNTRGGGNRNPNENRGHRRKH